MDADWTTSPSARRVQQHDGDARPAWLWSADGQHLLWHNNAADLFLAKLKKHGLKRAPLANPIKGQVARIIRMGSLARTSLARVQLIAGEKPASATCAATPLQWDDGQVALLLVGVDPIASEILQWGRDETGEAVVEASAEVEDLAPSVEETVVEQQVVEETPAEASVELAPGEHIASDGDAQLEATGQSDLDAFAADHLSDEAPLSLHRAR